MLESIILAIFLIGVASVIFIEVRNERKYQQSRREKREVSSHLKQKPSPKRSSERPAKETLDKTVEPTQKKEPEVSVPAKELPKANYPRFSHNRLIEMGLSDEEAEEFVLELIPQIETQIPLIEEQMNIPDFHQMERLTHSIKGSTTNLGIGGISDLLVAFNTYLKEGTDIDIAKAYFQHLVHYTKELKAQYA